MRLCSYYQYPPTCQKWTKILKIRAKLVQYFAMSIEIALHMRQISCFY